MFKPDKHIKEVMSLENLNKRLTYMGAGGKTAESRFQEDKLRTLKKSLLYSYQAATAVLADGREFRCLINDDKTSEDYNDKIISIPYKDICLNSSEREGTTTQGEEEIGMKCGDVFEWKETGTYWLVYLEYLEEDAYFRAKIRLCEAKADIGGHPYWIYIRGPVETTIQWNQKHNTVWNDNNYSLIVYITKNEETLNYFHRFTKLKINNETWEVDTVNPYYADGIIRVCLGEWFNNEMEDAMVKPELPEPPDENEIYIEGLLRVRPYDITTYTIHNADSGSWVISNTKASILESSEQSCRIEIITGKSGQFNLTYQKDSEVEGEEPEVICSVEIIIESL